jgi:predicted  nucleic acid-binding Zn-ribbon protein
MESHLEKWLLLDNQIKQYNEKIGELRERKKVMEKQMIDYVSKQKEHPSFYKVSTNEKVKFTHTNVYSPLTFTYLEKSLNEIVKNKEQVELILQYIRQKREKKVITQLSRF